MEYVFFLLGFVFVIKGADLLIDGASSLARKMGISSLIIGLTVVAFGTSVPELVINVFSAMEGKTDVALGNIIGSCISNLLLILGLTAIIFPLDVKISTAWKEIPFSLFAVALLFILCNDVLIDNTRESFLSRSDGIILFAFFGIFLYYVIEMAMAHKGDSPVPIPDTETHKKKLKAGPDKILKGASDKKSTENISAENKAEKKESALLSVKKDKPERKSGTLEKVAVQPVKEEEKEEKEKSSFTIAIYIILGLIGLFFGGRWVVDGAVKIATRFGLSEFLISATIIAVGSSLPELVTSLVAAYKKEPDMSVGNIVGSNIFNIFWVLGVSAIIRPIPVTLGINVDIIFLMVVTLYLFLFMFIGKKYKLERWQGIFFTILYIFYIVYIIKRG